MRRRACRPARRAADILRRSPTRRRVAAERLRLRYRATASPRQRPCASTCEPPSVYLRAGRGCHPQVRCEPAASRGAACPPQESCVAYIITEPCIGTKDTACVDVCPVDCIHPRKDEPAFETAEQLFIHPDECIDCGACVPACPVEAIFALDETPEKWKNFITINAQHYQK